MAQKGLVYNIITSGRTYTEKLLDIVSDYDIYCHFLGEDIDVGQTVSSPVRDDDTNPSFNIYVPTEIDDVREDEIWWKDLARGWYGDVFYFAKEYASFHFGEELEKRKDVIMFIDKFMDLGIFEGVEKEYHKRDIDMVEARKKVDIEYISRDFTRRDLHWWAKRAIDSPLLNKFSVESIFKLLDETLVPYKVFGQYELAFSLIVKDKCKVYRPELERDRKWRNCIPADSSYMFGINQLERWDYLVITKALKDIMTFKSFIECDSIAPQAESLSWDKDMLKMLELRYNVIYVVMDYDAAGIKAAEDLLKLLPSAIVVWVSTTKEYDDDSETYKVLDKDISDLTINKGLRASFNRMRKMFPLIPSKNFKKERVKYFEDLIEEMES